MRNHTLRLSLSVGILITVGALWSGSGWAADPSNGQKIAETWCATCHTVSSRSAGRDTAPPFSLIARNRNFDRDSLTRTLSDPHPPMPKITLSRQQLDDMTAYIRSLGPVE